MLWVWLSLQLPVGIIAGSWARGFVGRYFDRIEAEP